jgi:indole-3-glycerol phosphate synthase
MNILDQIVKYKQKEVGDRKELFSTRILEKSVFFESPTFSLRNGIVSGSGIIAEIKRKSPSKGIINPAVSVEGISIGYTQAGASALSILTDEHFFGGSNEDLAVARKLNQIPILRKDFVLEEYQVIEAKSIGADAILLIAAILKPEKIKILTTFAHTLGLEVLLEVHSKEELMNNLSANVDLIGVNNRDLKTFEVSIETSKNISSHIPPSVTSVSESGIDDPVVVHKLKEYGFRGFLIGERFMRHPKPEASCKEFIDMLK